MIRFPTYGTQKIGGTGAPVEEVAIAPSRRRGKTLWRVQIDGRFRNGKHAHVPQSVAQKIHMSAFIGGDLEATCWVIGAPLPKIRPPRLINGQADGCHGIKFRLRIFQIPREIHDIGVGDGLRA